MHVSPRPVFEIDTLQNLKESTSDSDGQGFFRTDGL